MPSTPGYYAVVDGIPYIHVYRSDFDPAAPTTGCAIGNDDGGPGTCGKASTAIAAGETLDVIVSGYGATSLGAYELVALAAGASVSISSP